MVSTDVEADPVRLRDEKVPRADAVAGRQLADLVEERNQVFTVLSHEPAQSAHNVSQCAGIN